MALEFTVQVDEWVEKAGFLATQAFQATGLDAVNDVKTNTPVDTGFLRSNWTLLRNDDPMPIAGRVPDPATVVAKLKLGDRLIIANPVVYAARVEFGFVGADSLGRTYNQKGRGMLQQTITHLPTIARRATARVMGGGPVGPGIPVT